MVGWSAIDRIEPYNLTKGKVEGDFCGVRHISFVAISKMI